MKRIKQIAAFCLLGIPVAAFASGAASGTITDFFIAKNIPTMHEGFSRETSLLSQVEK